jgi:branched-chain amino acid transport system substrate-binding protein
MGQADVSSPTRRGLLAAAAGLAGAGLGGWPRGVRAQTKPFRIAVLTDMTGYAAELAGPGSAVAARMASEDFGGQVLGRPIEVLVGDHQNKPDIGATVARQWFDLDSVNAIFDIPNSAVGFAVQEICRQKNGLVIFSTGGASDLTGKNCSPNSICWSYNTYAVARTTADALMHQRGTSWYFISTDNAGSVAMEEDAAKLLQHAGGTVLGHSRVPLGTTEYGAALIQAQASGAQVLMVTANGGDQTNALKQAREFGFARQGIKLASTFNDPLLLRALGPDIADGYLFATAWYYDMNDAARDFGRKFMARHGVMPSMFQAGVYSAVSNYLSAVRAAGTPETASVVARLRATPVHDMFTQDGTVRGDGQMVHTMYLLRGKGKAAMKDQWDLAEIVASVPPDQAFLPLSESACKMVG